ncbi:MAG: hypothetical protein V1822_03215, partial [Candidatus Micrarchaeota archaeon]
MKKPAKARAKTAAASHSGAKAASTHPPNPANPRAKPLAIARRAPSNRAPKPAKNMKKSTKSRAKTIPANPLPKTPNANARTQNSAKPRAKNISHLHLPANSPTQNPIVKTAPPSLERLCTEAFDFAKRFEYQTFSVQTLFSKKTLAAEEDFFDSLPIHGCMAAKNILNAKAAKILEKKSGKKFSKEPDVIFILDFANEKGSAKSQNLFIFGHYLKKSREYCQHVWAC